MPGDTRADMDGNTTNLAINDFTLSGVQAGAHRRAKSLAPISDGTGTTDRSRWAIETREHTVTRRVYQPTPEALEFLPHQVMKGGKEIMPAGVAQRRGFLGGSYDVHE